MRQFPFYWVDAFTTTPTAGNPCAVIFDADELTTDQMRSLAFEMGLSETAFVLRPSAPDADIRARYFTPAEEIPLAGHPTIATIGALIDAGRIAAGTSHLRLQLEAGVIGIDLAADGWIVMSQLAPRFLNTYPAEAIMPLFGLTTDDALPGAPIQSVSTGTPQLMIPVRDHAALRRSRIDAEAYSRFRAGADFFSPHLFALGGATSAGTTFARHFGVPPDTSEDPFTGSATGNMAAYLWHYALIERPVFHAEQGHWMGRPGSARVEVVGPRDQITAVRVAGQAVVLVRGTLSL